MLAALAAAATTKIHKGRIKSFLRLSLSNHYTKAFKLDGMDPRREDLLSIVEQELRATSLSTSTLTSSCPLSATSGFGASTNC